MVIHQRSGLLKGKVHGLPGRAVLAVSAAEAQGAGQYRHLVLTQLDAVKQFINVLK